MKIVKPHKARKPSASTGVPSFVHGKDHILKQPIRLQRLVINGQGGYDDGKDETWYDELNNSTLGAGIKFLDPTGVSSYYDVYQSARDMYNNPSLSNAGSLALELFGALPLVGKIGKAFKIGKKVIKRAGQPELEKMGQWVVDQGYPRATGLIKDGYDADQYYKSKHDDGKDDLLIQNTVAYNQWKSTLPKNLQIETPDYDLYGAFQAGLQPQWNDEDKSYHLGSRDPRNGRILKRPGHPTFGQAIYNDMSLGYYPIYKDGEIYTEQPLKYNKGKDSGIHIKKKNRGKFTALKKRTGKSASWFKAHGTPAQKKMAVFALNARKWKH